MRIFKKYILKTHVQIALINLPSQAQTKSQNNDIWLHNLRKNMLTKKLSFKIEVTIRFANGFSEKQQYFIRPSFIIS